MTKKYTYTQTKIKGEKLMKFDVYINTSVSVYDVEAKTEKEAQTKALKLMLKQIRQKDPSLDTEQVQHLRINYVMDCDDWYSTHGGNDE